MPTHRTIQASFLEETLGNIEKCSRLLKCNKTDAIAKAIDLLARVLDNEVHFNGIMKIERSDGGGLSVKYLKKH